MSDLIVLALYVIIIAFMLMQVAEKTLFHEEHEETAVIDTRILAHVRHPLYLGVLLLYLRFTLGTFSLLSFGIFILNIFIYNFLATYEEQDLERKFGANYLEYKRRVP